MQREGKLPQQGTGSREEEASRGPPASSAYSGEFYLYSFKIVPCTASYAHNWSLCPFVHPNEKARRRDPRLYSYQPLPCPFDKKGANCPHGDNCSYTHNVYEYWLHPKRFRTQMCQQGAACKRPLCFFAHNLQELRCPDGQLQRGDMPPPQDAPAAVAAQAASMQDMQHQQAAAAVAAGMGAGQYVPFAVMPSAAGPGASLPPLHPGFVPSPVAGAPSPQARMMIGQQMAGQQMMRQQQQQQQGWVHPGYMVPQGYAMLGGAQGQLYPFMHVGGADQGQQQQQYVPTARSQWQFGGSSPGLQLPGGPSAAAAAAAAAAVCAPMGGGAGGFQASLQHLDPALMGSQYRMVPSDNQVLLGQPAGAAGGDSSSGYLAAQQQQQQAQQAQQDAAAAAAASVMSGSQFSWNLNPAAGPSTTSASASMSVLSMPTVGLSSTASVPGSSNNSLSHLRPGQAGTVPLDVLQAMKHMSVRDCDVRDL